jgi:hypothetical protein
VPKQTCPHCGHTLTAAEIEALAKPATVAHLRKIGSAGGKASSAKVDTVERARKAVQARWRKHFSMKEPSK